MRRTRRKKGGGKGGGERHGGGTGSQEESPTDGVKSQQNADNELKRRDQIFGIYASEAHTDTPRKSRELMSTLKTDDKSKTPTIILQTHQLLRGVSVPADDCQLQQVQF